MFTDIVFLFAFAATLAVASVIAEHSAPQRTLLLVRHGKRSVAVPEREFRE